MIILTERPRWSIHIIDRDEAYSPHRFFAWRPVHLETGGFAWLQTVRRVVHRATDWEGSNWSIGYTPLLPGDDKLPTDNNDAFAWFLAACILILISAALAKCVSS